LSVVIPSAFILNVVRPSVMEPNEDFNSKDKF
jgi:hypothetical protein